MEIIQNADDNKYAEKETPMISISVFPERVKIECNELGFSRENVQALCRAGRSSKPPGQGYTGEKGIGFKSVFKLANRVHIRSEPFYFQLDQKRDLGMITPQWDKKFFKYHAAGHQTTIILDQICDGSRNFSSALQKDIGGIDPALLIFLRRIERLHLTLFMSASDVEPSERAFGASSGLLHLASCYSKTKIHVRTIIFTNIISQRSSRVLNPADRT
jgi:hypothetical protein